LQKRYCEPTGRAAYHAKLDYDHAIADYTEAIQILPNYAFAFYHRCQAKQKAGDAAGGEADIASAKAINPNVAD
jgi:tetratricopeptide (TPR) repeat protein